MMRKNGKSASSTSSRQRGEQRGARGTRAQSCARRPDGGRRGGNSASSARCVSGCCRSELELWPPGGAEVRCAVPGEERYAVLEDEGGEPAGEQWGDWWPEELEARPLALGKRVLSRDVGWLIVTLCAAFLFLNEPESMG